MEIVFTLNASNISCVIKLAPTIHHKDSLMVEKPEKWDILKFSDFDKFFIIFQFYCTSIHIGTNIANDFCTLMLELS